MIRREVSQSRRAILRQSVGLGIVAMGAMSPRSWGMNTPAEAANKSRDFVEVETIEGRLRGFRENDVCEFRGAKYAGAPVGNWRFKAPPPLAKWKGVRDALAWGHQAQRTFLSGRAYCRCNI